MGQLVKCENKMANIITDILVNRAEQKEVRRRIKEKIRAEQDRLTQLNKEMKRKQVELIAAIGGRSELRQALRMGDDVASQKLNRVLQQPENAKLLEAAV